MDPAQAEEDGRRPGEATAPSPAAMTPASTLKSKSIRAPARAYTPCCTRKSKPASSQASITTTGQPSPLSCRRVTIDRCRPASLRT
ncbi:MAG TPA: hypothetical protein VGF00_11300, partial [Acidimicrobiia bacterium]